MNEKQKEWIRFHSNEGNAREAARYGLKGMEERQSKGGQEGRGWRKHERPTRSVEVHRRRRKNGQSSEGRSEARKRKWRRDDAERFVSPFFSLFLSTFAPFLSLLLSCSRCLHDRRLKSRRATPNAITSVLFHLRSICRFEQTHVNTFARG